MDKTTSTAEISFKEINKELGLGETSLITLNDHNVRSLAHKPTGSISMDDCRGKLKWTTLTGTKQTAPPAWGAYLYCTFPQVQILGCYFFVPHSLAGYGIFLPQSLIACNPTAPTILERLEMYGSDGQTLVGSSELLNITNNMNEVNQNTIAWNDALGGWSSFANGTVVYLRMYPKDQG